MLFFLIVRGIIALIVGPIIGNPTPHFPLYVVEALIVEGVALAMTVDRPLRFGAVSGVLIGTIGPRRRMGVVARSGCPIPWNSGIFPEGAIFGFRMAVAGVAGRRLDRRAPGVRPAARASARCATPRSRLAVAMFALVGYSLYTPSDKNVAARWR